MPAIARKKEIPYSALADEFGTLKAQLAPLLAREAELKEIFEKSGFERVEGILYAVNIRTFPQIRLVMERVRAFLSPAQLAVCEETKIVTRITCHAHRK